MRQPRLLGVLLVLVAQPLTNDKKVARPAQRKNLVMLQCFVVITGLLFEVELGFWCDWALKIGTMHAGLPSTMG